MIPRLSHLRHFFFLGQKLKSLQTFRESPQHLTNATHGKAKGQDFKVPLQHTQYELSELTVVLVHDSSCLTSAVDLITQKAVVLPLLSSP